METISLTDEQEERARAIYHRVDKGDITSPTDFIEWENPSKLIDNQAKEEPFSRHKEFIDPTDIQGPTGSTGYLQAGRLKTALARMVNGDFEVERRLPPVLQKFDDGYYVTQDGHHRCMAAKALELDEFYVEYEDIPPRLLVDTHK